MKVFYLALVLAQIIFPDDNIKSFEKDIHGIHSLPEINGKVAHLSDEQRKGIRQPEINGKVAHLSDQQRKGRMITGASNVSAVNIGFDPNEFMEELKAGLDANAGNSEKLAAVINQYAKRASENGSKVANGDKEKAKKSFYDAVVQYGVNRVGGDLKGEVENLIQEKETALTETDLVPLSFSINLSFLLGMTAL